MSHVMDMLFTCLKNQRQGQASSIYALCP